MSRPATSTPFGFLPIVLMLLTTAAASTGAVAAGPEVGSVARLQNTAEALRDGAIMPLATGSAIHQGDELRTGAGSRLEMRFLDDTSLTLGADARLVIDAYVFEPAGDRGAIAVNAVTGALRFVSGRLGDVSDRQMTIRTAFATIGIRGTDFWAGPLRGIYGVLLLEGVIDVTNAATTRVLDAPGAGVDVPDTDQPPGEVVIWGAAKAAEALATTAFTP